MPGQPTVRNAAFALSIALGSLSLVGAWACGSHAPGASRDAGPTRPAHPAFDAGARDAGGPAKRAGRPPRIYAGKYVVTIRNAPHPEAPRIGYLRAGVVLGVRNMEPVGAQPGCLAGFWELETGGWVCNRKDVVAFEGRRPPERPPAQPDLAAPLPYKYGFNRRDGTAMYRRLPTDEEAAEFEGDRIPGLEVADGGGVAGEGAVAAGEGAPSGGEPGSAPGGAGAVVAVGAEGGEASPRGLRDAGVGAIVRRVIETGGTAGGGGESIAAPGELAQEASIDAGISLAALMGDPDSVLMRRLVKGFYVSLDREMRIRDRRYWRTLSNGFIPFGRINVSQWPSFRGVELDGTTLALPVGFVMADNAAVLSRDPATGRTRRASAPRKRSVFRIVGEETIHNVRYWVGADTKLYRASDVRRIDAVTATPAGLGPDEKWIDVDLSSQSVVAYVGMRPVYVTLTSTGKIQVPGDPELDRHTPSGDFRITSKHIAATMDGDTASDGPYSIEDVPYVMFFQLAYALHSAFWHNRFGYTKSHGCVNLAPLDAKWFFAWTSPVVPLGWHGAYPTPQQPGTRVIIRGVTPT